MTTSINTVPIPLQDPIAQPRRASFGKLAKDPLEGLISSSWVSYFNDLGVSAQAAPSRIGSVSYSDQIASRSATDISDGGLSGGLYRLSYYARITQAASTSSSLTVLLDWTDGGATPSYSGAAMTGNTVTTVQSGSILIQVDPTSPVRYSATYVSVGATVMKYSLHVVLEKVLA